VALNGATGHARGTGQHDSVAAGGGERLRLSPPGAVENPAMYLTDRPFILLVGSFVALVLAAAAGDFIRTKTRPLTEAQRSDLGIVLTAMLTLLGLLIGFTFAMATNRYDQRKNYEEAEANAIGTEYVRAQLLPAEDAARVQQLLVRYLDARVSYYNLRSAARLGQLDTDTGALQSELWAAVVPVANARSTAVDALVISGMNDVLNSQGYTQAAWWNRIPRTAWVLVGFIALSCSFLIGYAGHRRGWGTFVIVPVAVSIALFLIADIDSPRAGFITVAPQNLLALAQSIRPH
jgi:hypothetical protein